MPKVAKVEPKELNFSEFVIEELKKEARFKNVLSIALQDIYMFMGRVATTDGPEPERIGKLLQSIQLVHGDPMALDEGWMNRQKDEAIRTLFIYELMRQFTNFKRRQNK